MNLYTPTQRYPSTKIRVEPFSANLSDFFESPAGLIESDWPPTQIIYLGEYLNQLGCKTILVESHYIDRDYISDFSLFYSRSLCGYPNYCRRLHFFREAFDQNHWKKLVLEGRSDHLATNTTFLQESYLGFCVARPLPGSPIGRTVLLTLERSDSSGNIRDFCTIRDYDVHLGGFRLRVRGLAFQQQDQGVSACATTALWSAIHAVAPREGLPVPTPAEITEAASRYFLAGGRSLPSEGLNVHQICEAIRAFGLSPLVIPSISHSNDKAQLLSYLSSGFAPVLAIRSLRTGVGHAVCAVGVKLGQVVPQSDSNLHFRDASSALLGIYIHDDRLGPYASAQVYPWTIDKDRIGTALKISWPGQDVESEDAILKSIVVPVPTKLRLTVTRMRELGLALADSAGQFFPAFNRTATLCTRFMRGTEYRELARGFGLSDDGLYSLICDTIMSRYIGVIEISVPDGALFDVVLDTTETNSNPAALACVRRQMLPAGGEIYLDAISSKLDAQPII